MKGVFWVQKDVHYYGTYALARGAGLKPDVCRTIAYCSQGVDDNPDEETIILADGTPVNKIATAHHFYQFENLDIDDQCAVWLPFHFLPGNEGSNFLKRLICRMDSDLASEIVEHSLSLARQRFGVALMGITSHVYADTFSHYSFSGISSPTNKVFVDSIELYNVKGEIENSLIRGLKRFFNRYDVDVEIIDRFRTGVLEGAEITSQALGHGSVGKNPDIPYLQWSFIYENGNKPSGIRNNPEIFMEACRSLHNIFRLFAEVRPDLVQDNGIRFEEIEETIRDILNIKEPLEVRIQAWQRAAKAGELFRPGSTIPRYDDNIWLNQWFELTESVSPEEAETTLAYRFNEAAIVYRNYVLNHLLPHFDLAVHRR